MSVEDLLDQRSHFAFGKNWLDYANKIDEARIDQAVADLRRLHGGDLQGKTFLDIGCGSGLHALAAIRLGATKVVGLDIDADSITASQATFARFAPDAAAQFKMCSVFDLTPQDPGAFDVVYSWGVLHHTGDMQRAIEIASQLVMADGQLILALYKKTPFCPMWRRIKRWYSRATPSQQARARRIYVALRHLAHSLTRQDFDAYVRDYGKRRGMNFYIDVHDWLGGYPYQSISPAECHALMAKAGFVVAREFILRRGRYLPGLLGSGCDEYAFLRLASSAKHTA